MYACVNGHTALVFYKTNALGHPKCIQCEERAYKIEGELLLLLQEARKKETLEIIKKLCALQSKYDVCAALRAPAGDETTTIAHGDYPGEYTLRGQVRVYFKDNQIQVCGIPGEEHDCDAMGCPSTDHVLIRAHIEDSDFQKPSPPQKGKVVVCDQPRRLIRRREKKEKNWRNPHYG